MSSKSQLSYGERAKQHPHPVARKLFEIAEAKQTNVVVSADVTRAGELLDLADRLGPYIAVLKTHIDILDNFSLTVLEELKELAAKHNFLIFEDRKFVDIGNTVQKQYHGGALQISSWADIVNCTMLPGEGIVQALTQTAEREDFPYKDQRALLILATMTSKGSLATGEYTKVSVECARKYSRFVIGFVASRTLGDVETEVAPLEDEDFVLFTTGVNMASKGDKLGQQYQTPKSAVEAGADFIIAGRGIYAVPDPVASAKAYKEEGWNAYLGRLSKA
ncbi:orotidine 5'-phosphate decarboxylase [Arthrobotrys musiformis]|uniref:Orotidine 5'-phosphate decarboxylase n=1 Tax=Arthrobotrys musiformis TaxID=47236 RepID=A0AAV9WFA7_9PEZI